MAYLFEAEAAWTLSFEVFCKVPAMYIVKRLTVITAIKPMANLKKFLSNMPV
jgi:hypothetical protein